MPKPIVVLAVCYTAFILWIIYLATTGQGAGLFELVTYVPFGDRGAHFILIGLLTAVIGLARSWPLWSISVPRSPVKCNMLASSWVLLGVMTAEEGLQLLSQSRTADFLDLFANYLGIVVFDFAVRRSSNA